MRDQDYGGEREKRWSRRILKKGITSLRSTSLSAFILLAFLTFAPFLYFADRQIVFEVSDALIAGFSVGAFIRFAPAAWQALKLPAHDLHSGDILCVGVSFLCVGGIARFIGQWYWRAMDKPNWWIDSPILAYTTLILGIGYCLIQATTFSDRGVLVKGAGIRTSYVGLLSLGVAIVLIWLGWG